MKVTDEEFREIVSQVRSIASLLRELGLKPAGGNYKSMHQRISALGVDTSHFTGQASNRGRVFGSKYPLEDYLSNKRSIKSYNLKKRLLKECVLVAKCYSCGITEWMGLPAPLELEHINGNSEDNSLDNLTLLCPNCHAQTETYRGKNIRKASVGQR